MIKSAMITEYWTPQSSHRDTFFSIYLVLCYLKDPHYEARPDQTLARGKCLPIHSFAAGI